MSAAARLVLSLMLLAGCQPVASSTAPSPSPSATPRPTASPLPTPTPVPTPSPSPTPLPVAVPPDALAVEPFASGIVDPVGVVHAGDGSGRLFVIGRPGRVTALAADGSLLNSSFLDIQNRVLANHEQGFLGLAFHPLFEDNGRLFVNYTRRNDGATVISEFGAVDGQQADAASERILLVVPQPFANHNGGQLAFGPDGYLYIGLGDGGGYASGDPLGNAQNRNVLLGKILRINVDGAPNAGKAYSVPNDNPYAPGGIEPGGGLPEIWAYGLRNPWRFSFDPVTGDLYIGDVGQGRWEEIDHQPAASRGGENYGWNVREGRHCYIYAVCDAVGLEPMAEYDHETGCAVAGGFVYRGTRQPEMAGVYVFGDYCFGRLFTMPATGQAITPTVAFSSTLQISSLGEGEDGELYVCDLGGDSILRIVVP